MNSNSLLSNQDSLLTVKTQVIPLWDKKAEKGSLGVNREKSSLRGHICKVPKAENGKDKKVGGWLAHREQGENGRWEGWEWGTKRSFGAL